MSNMHPVVHFELPYEDRNRMIGFYEKVFKWKAQKLGPEMMNYVTVQTGETDKNNMLRKPGMINGGLYERRPDGAMYPSLVVATDNIEKTMKMINESGGQTLNEPMMIPGIGLYVAFKDTEGNMNSILQPNKMEYTEKVTGKGKSKSKK